MTRGAKEEKKETEEENSQVSLDADTVPLCVLSRYESVIVLSQLGVG